MTEIQKTFTSEENKIVEESGTPTSIYDSLNQHKKFLSDIDLLAPDTINSENKDTPTIIENNHSPIHNLEEKEISNVTETSATDSNSIQKDNDDSFEKEGKTEDDWLDIMGSGNFKKKIIKPGVGHDSRPDRGDIVTADIVFYVSGNVIEELHDLQFIVGDLDVVQGLDLVVCLMEKGEKSKVIIPSKLAYGRLGRSPDIPPDTDLECDIELKDIVNISSTDLSLTRRLELGNEKRTRGNFFYDRGEYVDAIHCYERASEYLDGVKDCSGTPEELSQELVDVRIKVYNNMAASHLKLNAYDSALKSVDNVLKVQPQNIKALFRKTKILSSKGNTEEAIACIKSAIKLEPETKVLHSELVKLQCKKRKEEHSQRIMYQRMFRRSEPKVSKFTFSNMLKWTAVTGGVIAVAFGLAAYRHLHI